MDDVSPITQNRNEKTVEMPNLRTADCVQSCLLWGTKLTFRLKLQLLGSVKTIIESVKCLNPYQNILKTLLNKWVHL